MGAVSRSDEPLQLSVQQARRIAVRAQLLDGERPSDLLTVVRQLTFLQLDPTAAVAPNAHLVAWSRLGTAYERADLDDAIAAHAVIELHSLLRPAEDLALFRAGMAVWPGAPPLGGWQEKLAGWMAANDACRADILARLTAEGPLTSRNLPDTCAVPWRTSGWNSDKNVVRMLEFLSARGEVAVSGRAGRERLWDLAERVHPEFDPASIPSVEEALAQRDVRRLAALGLARATAPQQPMEPYDVGVAGVVAQVEDVAGQWRLDPDQLARLDEPFAPRAALLSPFDRLVHDRKRLLELWDFDYQLEMYKPAAQRRWGYFALPVLWGEDLVGKLDATADRKAGVLRVDAFHEEAEPALGEEARAAIAAEVVALAEWLGVEVRSSVSVGLPLG